MLFGGESEGGAVFGGGCVECGDVGECELAGVKGEDDWVLGVLLVASVR